MNPNNFLSDSKSTQTNAAYNTRATTSSIIQKIYRRNAILLISNTLALTCIYCSCDFAMWFSCLSLILAAILFRNILMLRIFYRAPFNLAYAVTFINIVAAIVMIIPCGNAYGLFFAPVCFPLMLTNVISTKRQLRLNIVKSYLSPAQHAQAATIEKQRKTTTTIVASLVGGLANGIATLYCFFQGISAIIEPSYVGAIAATASALVFFLAVSVTIGAVMTGYVVSTLRKLRRQQVSSPIGLCVAGYISIIINAIPLLLLLFLGILLFT